MVITKSKNLKEEVGPLMSRTTVIREAMHTYRTEHRTGRVFLNSRWVCCVALLLVSCSRTYRNYMYLGDSKPEKETAVVEILEKLDICVQRIDGINIDGSLLPHNRMVYFLPGRHSINYVACAKLISTQTDGSLAYTRYAYDTKSDTTIAFDVEAGHTYYLNHLGVWERSELKNVTIGYFSVTSDMLAPDESIEKKQNDLK